MVRALSFFSLILICQIADSQVSGTWTGKWTNRIGHVFDLDMKIEEQDGVVKGFVIWTLRKTPRKYEKPFRGKSATSFVRGSFNENSRKLVIEGFSKIDPYGIIGYGEYRLEVSKSGKQINGISRSRWSKSWDGKFKSKYKGGLPSNFQDLLPKERKVVAKKDDPNNQVGDFLLGFLLLLAADEILTGGNSDAQENEPRSLPIASCAIQYKITDLIDNKEAGAIVAEAVASLLENRAINSKNIQNTALINSTVKTLKENGHDKLAKSADIAAFLQCVFNGI